MLFRSRHHLPAKDGREEPQDLVDRLLMLRVSLPTLNRLLPQRIVARLEILEIR